MKSSFSFLMLVLCFCASVYGQEKINLIENAVNGYLKENLGPNVNSSYDEVLPVVSADGKTLYAIRNNHPENVGGGVNNEDIWFSVFENGQWSAMKNIGPPLNNNSHNGVISVSPDGNTLYVAHTYNPDGTFRSLGLSLSTRKADGTWSFPQEINIQNHYNNSRSYNNYTFSNSRKYMVMALERNDTYGTQDLYVSFLQADGSYSEPKNMGEGLNTAMTECAPFIASDDKTLYYTSMGKPGYGNGDILVSRRLDDTWQNWSEPQNLGPEINTPGFDGFFTIAASGETAFLVSDKNSFGAGDIFQIKLAEAAKPTPTVLITGLLEDPETGRPLKADVYFYEIGQSDKPGTVSSNPIDGRYTLVVPVGKKYRIVPDIGETEGAEIDLEGFTSYQEVVLNFLAEGSPRAAVPLSKKPEAFGELILFDFDSRRLSASEAQKLRPFIQALRENQSLKIIVKGHTDSVGDAAYNRLLSQGRAEAVRAYLQQEGIPYEQIEVDYYGAERPLAGNEAAEGRRLNRRVELSIQ